jgi:hypothetical protein
MGLRIEGRPIGEDREMTDEELLHEFQLAEEQVAVLRKELSRRGHCVPSKGTINQLGSKTLPIDIDKLIEATKKKP